MKINLLKVYSKFHVTVLALGLVMFFHGNSVEAHLYQQQFNNAVDLLLKMDKK